MNAVNFVQMGTPAAVRPPRAMAVVGILAVLAMVATAGVAVAGAQDRARAALRNRFTERIDLAADFAETYVADVFARQRAAAATRLSAPDVGREDFELACDALGFSAAVLLDDGGRVIHVRPYAQELIGQPLHHRYAHLASAVRGKTAVSEVVPSAVTREPIVAFATPFTGPVGRRVFSGGTNVGESPLGAYLARAVPFRTREVILVDRLGNVAASTDAQRRRITELARERPELWRSIHRARQGVSDGDYFVSRSVGTTPLTIVAAVSTSELYDPLSGAGRTLPWVLLVAAAALGISLVLAVTRLQAAQHSLSRANADLDRLARVDGLTGLYNRRHIVETLDRLTSAARRGGDPVAVLVIDIDHFKRVNDTYGHPGGDAVLRRVAQRVADVLRTEDVAGRWGGEEIIVVMPSTTLGGALVAGERIRAAVARDRIEIAGATATVTVSVGCASGLDAPDELLHEADHALYRAKESGRDRVFGARADMSCPSCGVPIVISKLRIRVAEVERTFHCPACGAVIAPGVIEAVAEGA